MLKIPFYWRNFVWSNILQSGFIPRPPTPIKKYSLRFVSLLVAGNRTQSNLKLLRHDIKHNDNQRNDILNGEFFHCYGECRDTKNYARVRFRCSLVSHLIFNSSMCEHAPLVKRLKCNTRLAPGYLLVTPDLKSELKLKCVYPELSKLDRFSGSNFFFSRKFKFKFRNPCLFMSQPSRSDCLERP